MKGIFKLLVTIGGPGEVHEIHQTDAIEYVSDVWLVPEWIKQSSTGLQKPARIIRVGHILDPGRSADGTPLALTSPVPQALFDCQIMPSPTSGFLVHDLPPILLNPDGTPGAQA